MELTQISDILDTRLNSFEVPISVDEYEKSLYLTRAQKQIYKEMCDAFEVEEVIATWLHPFIVEWITAPTVVVVNKQTMLKNTVNIVVPDDIYRVVWEKAVLGSDLEKYNLKDVKVLKTRIAEIPYKQENPFRQPDDKEILRIVTGNVTTSNIFEIMLPENTTLLQYSCKYLKDIKPIILEALPDGLTIEDEIGPLNTEYSDEILEKIIDLAVVSILQDKTAISKQNVV